MADDPQKDFFEGFEIVTTPRFREITIFGQTVEVRTKYTVSESAKFNKLVDRFQGLLNKINEKASDDLIKAYETATNEVIKFVMRTDTDREYISSLVLNPAEDADEILELGDLLDIVRRSQKVEEEKAKEEAGKASDG